MKALFISYNQAYGEDVAKILDARGQRGFTRWDDIQGQGSTDGEPHFGNHAWPVMNNAILTMVDDDLVPLLLDDLKAADEESMDLGLRAFAWDIVASY